MSLVNLLFGYKGRINRTQYWVGILGSGTVIGAIAFVMAFSMIMGAAAAPKTSVESVGFGLMAVIGVLVALSGWVTTALQWKRFHDRGRPGWIALLPLIPAAMILTQMVSGTFGGAPGGRVIADIGPWIFLNWAIGLYFFVELGCLAGNAGANKYGNPPGGGLGGSAPAPTPSPQAPAANPAAPASAMSSLFGAQSAMERAIAEHQTARPAMRPAMAASPAPAPSSGGAPSFGRRAPR